MHGFDTEKLLCRWLLGSSETSSPQPGDIVFLHEGVRAPGSGFRVPGPGFRVPGRVPGSESPGSGFRVPGPGPGSGFRVPVGGSRVTGDEKGGIMQSGHTDFRAAVFPSSSPR